MHEQGYSCYAVPFELSNLKKKKKMNMHALKKFFSIEGYRRLSEILYGHAQVNFINYIS